MGKICQFLDLKFCQLTNLALKKRLPVLKISLVYKLANNKIFQTRTMKEFARYEVIISTIWPPKQTSKSIIIFLISLQKTNPSITHDFRFWGRGYFQFGYQCIFFTPLGLFRIITTHPWCLYTNSIFFNVYSCYNRFKIQFWQI